MHVNAALILAGLKGADYFFLLYIWLGSAWLASWLSGKKGYGEKFGLGTGLLLSVVGIVVWLAIPKRKQPV